MCRQVGGHGSGLDDSLVANGALPHQRRVDALELRSALGYITLVDVVDAGHDFRYRLYGSTIARVSGRDLTGVLMSEHHTSAYVTEFSIASYRASRLRRHALYTERTPALAERTTRWQRLACPLVDNDGVVTRFLSATVPVGSDGRVITS